MPDADRFGTYHVGGQKLYKKFTRGILLMPL